MTWKDLVENGLLLSATPTSRTSSSKRAAVAAAAEEQERKRRRSEEAQQRREERAREQQEERERAARQVALTRSARASAESTPPCPPPSTTTPSSSSTSSSSSSSSTSSSSSSSSSTHTNEPATSPSREWPEWRCETTSGLGDCVARLPSLFLPPSTPSAEQLAVLCHVFDNALDALMLTDSGIDLSVAACNDAFALRDNMLLVDGETSKRESDVIWSALLSLAGLARERDRKLRLYAAISLINHFVKESACGQVHARLCSTVREWNRRYPKDDSSIDYARRRRHCQRFH